MTRITRRTVERSLRTPVPGPDPELGRRIKDQIPAELFAPPTAASATSAASAADAATGPGSTGRHRRTTAAWAVAASVVVAAGAGYLAARLFEDRQPLSPTSAIELSRKEDLGIAESVERRSAMKPVVEPPRERANDAAATSAGSTVNGVLAHAAAPSRPAPAAAALPAVADEPDGLGSQPAATEALQKERQDQAQDVDAEARDAIQPVEVPEIRSAEAAEAAAPADRRGREEAPATEAPRIEAKVAARETDPIVRETEAVDDFRAKRPERRVDAAAAAFEIAGDGYVATADHPVSTVAATSTVGSAGDVGATRAKDSLASGGARSDAAVESLGGAVALLLDAAADRGPAQAITVEGATRAPGRLVLLVTAPLAPEIAPGSASERDAVIELAFEPAQVARYRLLASHADPPVPPPSSSDAAGTRPSAAAVVRRIAVLYELEPARAVAPGTMLATARVRPAGRAQAADRPQSRAIAAADFAAGWGQASVALRLAVLGAELGLAPDDVNSGSIANLRRELDRAQSDSRVEPAVTRRAADLLAVASRSLPAASATAPAAVKARNNG